MFWLKKYFVIFIEFWLLGRLGFCFIDLIDNSYFFLWICVFCLFSWSVKSISYWYERAVCMLIILTYHLLDALWIFILRLCFSFEYPLWSLDTNISIIHPNLVIFLFANLSLSCLVHPPLSCESKGRSNFERWVKIIFKIYFKGIVIRRVW